MITIRENIKEVLESLPPSEIITAIDGESDYILLMLHCFNVGWYATIENVPYSEELAENGDGNLFLDKDDLLRLLQEVQYSNAEALAAYI
jgi:hypothetical protein